MTTQYGIISVSITDDLGVTAAHDIFCTLDDTTTLASILTQANAYLTLVKPLTDGKSNSARVTVLFPPADFNASAATGKAVDTTGLFTFAQADSPYKFSVDIPAIADAVIVNGKINAGNSDVAAWVDWWAAPHSGVRGITKFRNVTAGFLKSAITSRKHRRSLTRSSTSIVSS
jgi:hypothetical protein